ncbi:MAG: aldehyde dehydrogenase family protein [Myxococcota bacterium]
MPSPQPTKATPTTIPCVEPASGARLGEVAITSPEQTREAIARARDAQRILQKTSFATRRSVLRHLQAHILEHADELCDIIVRDSGKTRENAMMGEVWPVSEKIRWTIRHGERHLKDESVSSGLFLHKKATIQYRPRGVIGVICPWNYPLQNIFGPTVHSLFAGNATVVKVSEHVAWSTARFQRIFDEALDAHNLPRDLVQCVQGYGDTGAALVSGGVDLIIFTGSMGNGRKVIAESAKSITPVILELGGKDSMIVCEDADLEQAAYAALNGSFIAAGQNCLAAERTLVHRDVYDAFVARVAELARSLRQGTPHQEQVEVGALVTPQQLEIVEHLVDDARRKGARALVGGERVQRPGNFFAPTILVDVTPSMKIMHEETFGPVMAICRVDSDEDAIRITNSTQYGLGATIMTKSRTRARRLMDAIDTGSASANDFGLAYMAQDLPFGGVRGSGFGRLNGRDGLRACTNPKALLEDRFSLHAPAKIYPVGDHDYDLVRGVVKTLYGVGLKGRAAGVRDLAKTLRRKLRG